MKIAVIALAVFLAASRVCFAESTGTGMAAATAAAAAAGGGSSGGSGGGGGGGGSGYPYFSMSATSLLIPPSFEPKTKIVDGLGMLAILPRLKLSLDLHPVAGVPSLKLDSGGAPPSPAETPMPSGAPSTPPSLVGGNSGVVLQGLTDKIADTVSPSPAPGATAATAPAEVKRGIASTKLLAAAARPKAAPGPMKYKSVPTAVTASSRGVSEDGYIKVFRSIQQTYGWNPGSVEPDPDAPAGGTAAQFGHRR